MQLEVHAEGNLTCMIILHPPL